MAPEAVDQAARGGVTAALPRWDMTSIYPGLDSRAFAAAWRSLVADIAKLRRLFDTHDIRPRRHCAVDPSTVALFEAATGRLNSVWETFSTIRPYVWAFVSTDSSAALAASPAPTRHPRPVPEREPQPPAGPMVASSMSSLR